MKRREVRTFFIDKPDKSSQELDHAIGLRGAFLHRQCTYEHLQQKFLEYPLSNRLEPLSSLHVLDAFGCFCLDFVERDEILLVICSRNLSLVDNSWDMGGHVLPYRDRVLLACRSHHLSTSPDVAVARMVITCDKLRLS